MRALFTRAILLCWQQCSLLSCLLFSLQTTAKYIRLLFQDLLFLPLQTGSMPNIYLLSLRDETEIEGTFTPGSPGDLVRLGEYQEMLHLHLVWFTQADQTTWTMLHSYSIYSFGAVLPKITTDQKGKKSKRKKKTHIIAWPGASVSDDVPSSHTLFKKRMHREKHCRISLNITDSVTGHH